MTHAETIQHEAPVLTAESISEQYPAIAEQLRQKGAAKERERIQAVEQQLISGHEVLVQTLKFDGKTSGAEAAIQILAAEKTLRTHQLAQLKADTPPVLPMAFASDPMESDTGEDNALPDAEAYAEKWRKSSQLRQEFTREAAYVAFMKAKNNGQLKILTRSA